MKKIKYKNQGTQNGGIQNAKRKERIDQKIQGSC